MKLALFTPGARLWPVQRNFEVFIASLGEAAAQAAGAARPSREFEARLIALHRELYDTLLRPAEYLRREPRSLADCFWPDLQDSTTDELFCALLFFFTQRHPWELSAEQGVTALRSIFFSHESAEPAIWLHSTRLRLAPLSDNFPQYTASFTAPASLRTESLACAILAGLDRPLRSPGWIRAELRRGTDGRVAIRASCGLDPSLGLAAPEHAAVQLRQQLQVGVWRAFQWPLEQAA